MTIIAPTEATVNPDALLANYREAYAAACASGNLTELKRIAKYFHGLLPLDTVPATYAYCDTSAPGAMFPGSPIAYTIALKPGLDYNTWTVKLDRSRPGRLLLIYPMSPDTERNHQLKKLGAETDFHGRRYRAQLLPVASSIITGGWLIDANYRYEADAWAAISRELRALNAIVAELDEAHAGAPESGDLSETTEGWEPA